jgi:hypothetical protein
LLIVVVRPRGSAASFDFRRWDHSLVVSLVVNDVGGCGHSVGAAPPRRGACSQQALASLVLKKERERERERGLDFASLVMRETHEGVSQTHYGYLLTPLAVTTHLRRLRLGDLSRWVRRGCLGRAEAKAQASSPCPTRSGTSRYKKKSGSTPSNPSGARLPNTVFAKHHGAPWRSAGGVSRQCGSRRRCPGPSQIAPAIWRAPGGERARAQALRARECSPLGGRPHVQRDQESNRISRTSCPPRPTGTCRDHATAT